MSIETRMAAEQRYVVYPIAKLLATSQVHQGDALVIDRHRGEEGLVFLRDTENRSSGSKIDFPIQGSRQLMTVEARVKPASTARPGDDRELQAIKNRSRA